MSVYFLSSEFIVLDVLRSFESWQRSFKKNQPLGDLNIKYGVAAKAC